MVALGPASPSLPTAVRAQGCWLPSFLLIASGWVCVRPPFLTSSASVSPIAFWKASFSWAEVLPRRLERCEMKLLQRAVVFAFSATEAVIASAGCEDEGRKLTL